jgi:glycosyltransferase involved in cell wall biosynthesis
MSAIGISVVTTTWNERENIKNLILNVRTVLKNVPHEIIVVDDNFSDGTFQIAKRYADTARAIREKEKVCEGYFHLGHAIDIGRNKP